MGYDVMLGILNPTEKVRLDNKRLEELYQQLGPVAAENVISRAMEELAVRLAKVARAYNRRDLNEIRKIAHSIKVIADQVGMSTLGCVAADVAALTARNDGAALAATTARLTRLGERSLMAVWDLQDLSV